MKNWIMAIRPHTLFASLAPVLLGLAVAYYETHTLNALVAILTALCALLLQAASNIANDYIDAARGIDTIERVGFTRVTSSGLIAKEQMKKALIGFLLLAFLLGIYLMIVGGPVIIAIGLLSLYFAYGYTGGPFPLSYNGLGEVAALLFFGLLAVFGTTYLQTHAISPLSLFLGLGPGVLSACVMAINNLRDLKTDEKTGKKTLAVRFGETFQRNLCISFLAVAMLICLYNAFIIKAYWSFLAFIPFFLFRKTWLHLLKGPVDQSLNGALATTAKFNFLYCLILSLALFIL